jgi:hypothetical protein
MIKLLERIESKTQLITVSLDTDFRLTTHNAASERS